MNREKLMNRLSEENSQLKEEINLLKIHIQQIDGKRLIMLEEIKNLKRALKDKDAAPS